MNKLIKKAIDARKKAYAPYSNFKVGAAIETKKGKVYTGCNVENATYGATCCAERVALFKAISEGERSFERIAIVADTKDPCPPCGICRQALYELSPNIMIVMANTKGKSLEIPLSRLLPHGFHKASLK